MLLLSITVTGPEFKVMSSASIRINLKYDFYLLKQMLERI